MIPKHLISPTPSNWSKQAAWRRRNRWWLMPLARIKIRYYGLRRKLQKLL